MRFSIRYHADYRYGGRVYDQHNVLRVKPAATATQRVRAFRLAVEPQARTRSYVDYFGTEVVEFNVPAEHDRLAITADADVTTETPPQPPATVWEALREPGYVDAGGEFLLPSPDRPANGALESLREAVRADTPDETLRRVFQVIPERFEYRRGVTFVGSTVDDLLAGGAGVCQDFVHLGLILLRDHGIAARYVSGYLFATRENGGEDSVEVDTHAWVEALLPDPARGDEPRWVGADPTNAKLAGEEHVKIGHGRHYGDVAPIRGVFKGTPATSEHAVNVTMTRLG